MLSHAERVREVAATLEMPLRLREELACMALCLDESPEEVFAEALSELRTLRGVDCSEWSCQRE